MIEKLTPEQEEQLAVYRDKWVHKLHELQPLTEQRVRDILAPVFEKILKREMPERIIIAANPLEAWKLVEKECELEHKAADFIWPYLDGVWSSGYFAWADYYQNVLGLKFDKEVDIYKATWELDIVYPLDDVVIVSDTLREVHYNPGGQLHNSTGPAIRYEGGFCVWALNGVRVPKWLVETKDTELDPKKFAELNNVEIRREFVRKIGIERLIDKLNTEILDQDGDYELHLVDLGDEVGEWPYLKMLNPSIGVWHMECVEQACKTVKEALEWRNQSPLKPEALT